MNPPLQCPKCRATLLDGVFNQDVWTQCPSCRSSLQVEVFPALFQEIVAGVGAEAVLMDDEASCFYHPQKKAVVPCAACGRFLCALCDCELQGEHLCPACLEAGKTKGKIEHLTEERVLHQRQALLLAFLPLFVTGLAAIIVAWRHWKSPDSLVSAKPWAMPLALGVGILQTVCFTLLIILAFQS